MGGGKNIIVDDLPHSECGCGSGDSGCGECGACKVCAGVLPVWGGGGGGLFGDLPDEVVRIRQKGGKPKEKAKKAAEKEKGEKAMVEGLKLLFGSTLPWQRCQLY